MNCLFLDYLFSQHCFYGEQEQKDWPEALFGLARIFGIDIKDNVTYASLDMVKLAEANIGNHVPPSFYRGFPESVLRLAPGELLLDQLFHYYQTYYLGDFSVEAKSILEEPVHRLAFAEHPEPKLFRIVLKDEAVQILRDHCDDLAASSRPLNKTDEALLLAAIKELYYVPARVSCVQTAISLCLALGDPGIAASISLPHFLDLVGELAFKSYGAWKIDQLNLKNKDRVFLSKCLDIILERDHVAYIDTYSKRREFVGVLHHLHYRGKTPEAKEWIASLRNKKGRSFYSDFETLMEGYDYVIAAKFLLETKGPNALLRQLDYLLSRANEYQAEDILSLIDSAKRIVLIQLYYHYAQYADRCYCRSFTFPRHHLLCSHNETLEESARRKSFLPKKKARLAADKIKELLAANCRGTLGKVYVDPSFAKIAPPLEETTSSSGYGVLPKGSRVNVGEGRFIRLFTYWEKVNDIDLSLLGYDGKSKVEEFSWRTMYHEQCPWLVFSGDVTSGYDGGSEYFDVDLVAFKEENPGLRYLLACDNVFSAMRFAEVYCKAGFMLRESLSSGEIFEPKTVQTSFTVDAESTYAVLFAFDLETNEIVWLNLSEARNAIIAGESVLDYVLPYLTRADILSMGDIASMLGEVVSSPEEADVVFSDEEVVLKEGAKQIHSYDISALRALLND